MQPALALANGYGFDDADEENAFKPTPAVLLQRSISGAIAIDDRYTLTLEASIVDAGSGVGGTQDAIARAAFVDHVRQLLRTRPSFSVMGLSHPALTPSRLVEVREGSGRVERLSLGYGDAQGSAGRFVLVVSGDPGRPLDDLAGLLASEAQRLGEAVGERGHVRPEHHPARVARHQVGHRLAGRLGVRVRAAAAGEDSAGVARAQPVRLGDRLDDGRRGQRARRSVEPAGAGLQSGVARADPRDVVDHAGRVAQ